MIRTPGTRVVFADVAGWIAGAVAIDGRRCSAGRYRAIEAHLSALPIALVEAERDAATLRRLLAIMLGELGGRGFARPQRGWRGDAPQTEIIVRARNAIARLERARAAPARPAYPGVGHNGGPPLEDAVAAF